MGRWSDLARWRGPTPNCGDGDRYANEPGDRMTEHRGLVVHIAEGYFEGTIAWQKNPDANVSSQFIGGRGGQRAQLVDTDIRAWTQRAGNSGWLSVEMEGFTPGHPLHKPGWERLTNEQILFAAQLLARAHRTYGVPVQIATGPTGRGLGHHSMGGASWGHLDCPGPAIISQKPLIVRQALLLLTPTPETEEAPEMLFGRVDKKLAKFVSTGVECRWIPNSAAATAMGATTAATRVYPTRQALLDALGPVKAGTPVPGDEYW